MFVVRYAKCADKSAVELIYNSNMTGGELHAFRKIQILFTSGLCRAHASFNSTFSLHKIDFNANWCN